MINETDQEDTISCQEIDVFTQEGFAVADEDDDSLDFE